MTTCSKRALAVAVAVMAAVPATAAAKAPQLTPLASARFPDRAYVLTLPGERRLTAEDVEVRENGEPVASPSLAPADRLGNSAFASVLVIDASRSMKGDAIANAMAA